MQALSVLYRLADVYPPGTPDGDVLLRAAHQLLRELKSVEHRGGLRAGHAGGQELQVPARLVQAHAGARPQVPADRHYGPAATCRAASSPNSLSR